LSGALAVFLQEQAVANENGVELALFTNLLSTLLQALPDFATIDSSIPWAVMRSRLSALATKCRDADGIAGAAEAGRRLSAQLDAMVEG